MDYDIDDCDLLIADDYDRKEKEKKKYLKIIKEKILKKNEFHVGTYWGHHTVYGIKGHANCIREDLYLSIYIDTHSYLEINEHLECKITNSITLDTVEDIGVIKSLNQLLDVLKSSCENAIALVKLYWSLVENKVGSATEEVIKEHCEKLGYFYEGDYHDFENKLIEEAKKISYEEYLKSKYGVKLHLDHTRTEEGLDVFFLTDAKNGIIMFDNEFSVYRVVNDKELKLLSNGEIRGDITQDEVDACGSIDNLLQLHSEPIKRMWDFYWDLKLTHKNNLTHEIVQKVAKDYYIEYLNTDLPN